MNTLKAQYAVIFTSQRREGSDQAYNEMSEKMLSMVKNQPGFISADSLRNADGFGITISYWSTLESIKDWKSDGEHVKAQDHGRSSWYSAYSVRICHIAKEYSFESES